MPDLNGSLTLRSPSARRGIRASRILTACVAVLGLAACHNDDSTAPLTASAVTVLSGGSQSGSLSPVLVLATAAPGAAATIMVTAGDAQSAAAGSALSSPLTVRVVDLYGNAVPNVTVTFSDDASGSLTATTVTTDAFGVATDALTLGPNAGPDDVTASIDTPSGPVTATLHETAM